MSYQRGGGGRQPPHKSRSVFNEKTFLRVTGRKSGVDWKKNWVHVLDVYKMDRYGLRVAWVMEKGGKYIVGLLESKLECRSRGVRAVSERGMIYLTFPGRKAKKIEIKRCFSAPACNTPPGGFLVP